MAVKTIFMVVESLFPEDPRVFRESEYLKQNYRIFILALGEKSKKVLERSGRITVFRIPNMSGVGSVLQKIPLIGKFHYMISYLYITLVAVMTFIATWPLYRYRYIHVHNPPDTFFVLGGLGKLLGTKFVYDVHDLSPELYVSRYPGRFGFIYKTLNIFEGWSCKLADTIITTNVSYKNTLVDRHHLDREKIYIVRNDPDLDEYVKYDFSDIQKDQHRWVLLFIGAINPQDGLDILLEVVHLLVRDHGREDLILLIVGDGDALPDSKIRAQELGVEDYIEFKGFVRERREIQRCLHLADVCVEPAPSNPVNDLSTFVKIMEYMAARKPIVAFDLPESRFSADDSAILIQPGDIAAFALSVVKLLEDRELRVSLGERGYNRIHETLNWRNATRTLGEAYSSMN